MAEKLSTLALLKQNADGDRRSAIRKKRRLHITWRLLGEKEDLMTPGEICNLSAVGIALSLDAPVRVGNILVVQLQETVAGFAEPFLVRIKHIQPRDEGGWLVGCSFARQVGEADLAALVEASL